MEFLRYLIKHFKIFSLDQKMLIKVLTPLIAFYEILIEFHQTLIEAILVKLLSNTLQTSQEEKVQLCYILAPLVWILCAIIRKTNLSD